MFSFLDIECEEQEEEEAGRGPARIIKISKHLTSIPPVREAGAQSVIVIQ